MTLAGGKREVALDERGNSCTVNGENVFSWHQRTLKAEDLAANAAGEVFGVAAALCYAGHSHLELAPIPQHPGEPDVYVRFPDGSESFVEVTRAVHAQDQERMRLIREIERRVLQCLDGRIPDAHFDFAFHDCPSKRDMPMLVKAIVGMLVTPGSWPDAKVLTSPDWLLPYGHMQRFTIGPPLLNFATDAVGIPIHDQREVKLAIIATKVAKVYIRRHCGSLWTVLSPADLR